MSVGQGLDFQPNFKEQITTPAVADGVTFLLVFVVVLSPGGLGMSETPSRRRVGKDLSLLVSTGSPFVGVFEFCLFSLLSSPAGGQK